jgi:hypothetical protein
MTVSTLEYIKEEVRQKKTGDTNFLKRFLYFFELIVPPEKAKNQESLNFLFPLILPPESIMLEEPFSVEETETQMGGLFIEENGIIKRTLTIKGHTGFKPRLLRSSNTNPLKSAARASLGAIVSGSEIGKPDLKSLETVSYSRKLPIKVLAAISGHRHFQYLQDSIFRTYADLKKDPASAMGTSLRFHNPKDDEHWEVVPKKFILERDSSKNRFLYYYTIELTVVGPAKEVDFDYIEDKTLLEQFTDVLRIVKKGLDLANGSVQDLIRLQGEIRSSISNISVIIDSVTAINSSIDDFVKGNKRLIDSTHSVVLSTMDLIDSSLNTYNKLFRSRKVKQLPEPVVQTIRSLNKGLELVAANPSIFSNTLVTKIEDIRKRQNRYNLSTERINNALNSESPTTFSELKRHGTGLTRGDALAINGELEIGNEVYQYTSIERIQIMSGDTLVSLAAKYMGNARLWQYIAIVNGLDYPFSNDVASYDLSKRSDIHPFNNALGIGDFILIPSNNTPLQSYIGTSIIGTALTESLENHLFGINFALDPIYNKLNNTTIYTNNRVRYDIPVDKEKNNMDVKLVKGIPNLVQAIILRIIVEKGTALLYRKFGLNRIVSLGFTLSDLENAKYRIRETILADTRINGIEDLELIQENDALVCNLTISAKGFNDAVPLRLTVG